MGPLPAGPAATILLLTLMAMAEATSFTAVLKLVTALPSQSKVGSRLSFEFYHANAIRESANPWAMAELLER